MEFVGLRSKMYSMLPKDGDKKAVAKGVNNMITKRVLTLFLTGGGHNGPQLKRIHFWNPYSAHMLIIFLDFS